ncbi:MAG: RMD1 family protein [Xanthobacteraceae bacterium]
MLTTTDTRQLEKPAVTPTAVTTATTTAATATAAATTAALRKRGRAILLSDRIDTSQLEHDHVVATIPLTYKFGKDGFVTLFRYGVTVMIGLSPEEEDEALQSLKPRLIRPVQPQEEESVTINLTPDRDDQIMPGGPIVMKAITPGSLIVIADALSKSVVLARDEREVAAVFDLVEPFARQLAEKGRANAGRRTIFKQIGNALLVQQRVAGRVAVSDKPDVLWDRPDLERLYARLEDEYELRERADALFRKLSVIAETAQVLTDILDTKRSFRLEMIIVILIAVELLIAGYQTLPH